MSPVSKVVVNKPVGNGHDGAMTREDEMWFEGLEAFQLQEIFVHVAGVRRNEDGSNAGQHIASDQPRFTEQTNVARMVSGGDEYRPSLSAEDKDFSVGQHTLARDAFRSVIASPNGDIKCFP